MGTGSILPEVPKDYSTLNPEQLLKSKKSINYSDLNPSQLKTAQSALTSPPATESADRKKIKATQTLKPKAAEIEKLPEALRNHAFSFLGAKEQILLGRMNKSCQAEVAAFQKSKPFKAAEKIAKVIHTHQDLVKEQRKILKKDKMTEKFFKVSVITFAAGAIAGSVLVGASPLLLAGTAATTATVAGTALFTIAVLASQVALFTGSESASPKLRDNQAKMIKNWEPPA